MIGTILLLIAAVVSAIAIFKDNQAEAGERSILGLDTAGFVLLALATLAFGFGLAKEIGDSIASSKAAEDLEKRLTSAEEDRDLAKTQLEEVKQTLDQAKTERAGLQTSLSSAETNRDELEAKLEESSRELDRVKNEIENVIHVATAGVRREVDHPVVSDVLRQEKPVVSQVTGRPLTVKAGDEISFFFYESQDDRASATLTIGMKSYAMKTDDQGRGSIRVVGMDGEEMPVLIRLADPLAKPPGGIKMTVTSSYTPDVVELLRKALQNHRTPKRKVAKK
jgi:F0F1-type ATP synthase membrane subunit b/b'